MADRTILLGTDWWTDCDDIAAVRIACRAHRKGLWNLAGVVIDACMEYSAASLILVQGLVGLKVPRIPQIVRTMITKATMELTR